MKKIFNSILAVALLFALNACRAPQNIPYFQDAEDGSVETIENAKTIRILPGDKISIIVNSRDPQISNLFNLAYATRYVGDASGSSVNSYSTGVQGYAVTEEGTIDFPILGELAVSGLTREEIAAMVKNMLIDQDLCKDPVVTVEYLNLKVSVLGEVTRPGRYPIERDEFTILDALSAAGDLTIFGIRDNVKVIRAENGMRKTYVVSLTSASELMSSPVYYLQQNDIVYVEPNDVRARQSTVNGNNFLSASFWMSVASLLTTISYYFFLR